MKFASILFDEQPGTETSPLEVISLFFLDWWATEDYF